MIIGLLIYATVHHYKHFMITVKAQLVDATVIKTSSSEPQAKLPQKLMIQYVYQYHWNQQAYISRDLVQCTYDTHQDLTSNEWRLFFLNQYLKSGTDVNIWINPDNPYDTTIKLPFRE
ncbi:MAG: hypothetical protein OQK49_01830 [Proteobacteria bacterium]|nr:hypothetical protein [Pseudomonadota bacterium]